MIEMFPIEFTGNQTMHYKMEDLSGTNTEAQESHAPLQVHSLFNSFQE